MLLFGAQSFRNCPSDVYVLDWLRVEMKICMYIGKYSEAENETCACFNLFPAEQSL